MLTPLDAYTLEELRREYNTSDRNGRIRLLQRLHKGGKIPPFDIALSAVEDADVQVRQWMARHGHLGYSDDEEPSRPNLAARLKNDPDPFVRACLRENPTVFDLSVRDEDWMEHFREATHLERLALVRNPNVGDQVIRKLFDYEDRELVINIEAREELVLAFLANRQALSRSKSIDVKHAFDQAMGAETLGALDWVMTSGHFSELWTLISKWPEGTGNLQYAVYRYVNAPDDTKAEVYRACAEPVWRRAILENCGPDDLQTIWLGMEDPDDGCREIAFRKLDPRKLSARAMTKVLLEEIPSSDREGYDREVHRRALALHAIPAAVNERLQIVLQGDDKAALCGLAENRSLPMEYLIRARNRLYDLEDNVGAWSAQQTIEEVRKTQVPEDPADLFGEEGRRGKFSEDKIDFIGTRLLSFEREITRRLKLLVIGIGIAIGIALFPLLWSVYTLIR